MPNPLDGDAQPRVRSDAQNPLDEDLATDALLALGSPDEGPLIFRADVIERVTPVVVRGRTVCALRLRLGVNTCVG